MTNFIVDRLCSLYNSFRAKLGLWPSEPVKRRRNSIDDDDDEEEDLFNSLHTLSKRPKWITSAYPSNVIMAPGGAGGPNLSRSSATVDIPIKVESKKNFQKRFNHKVTENGADIAQNHSPIESRPPLSDLAVKTKSRGVPPDNTFSSTVTRVSQRHHLHVKRQNGVYPSLLSTFSSTSSLKSSKSSYTPKQTALNETFKIEERLKYSELLADYYKPEGPNAMRSARKNCYLRSNIQKPIMSFSSKSVEVIDLTNEDIKRTRIPVKTWKADIDSDEEMKILYEKQVPRTNSLERKLSQHSMVSPEWITEMQKKYSEKEQQRLRQLAEVKLKKDIIQRYNKAQYIDSLDERIRKHLQVTDVVLDDTEEVAALPEITPAMKKKIDASLRPGPQHEVLVDGFGQRITRSDIQTLKKLNWLNDEVINFYMNLIIERGKENDYLSVYSFNTFFYPKLFSYGYSSLKKWTKKVDIFSHKFLLVPIHLGVHWCMATIDFRDRTVRYYDSMGGCNSKCLKFLLNYLNEESLDKKKKPYDTSDWKTENVKDIPQQMNGSDCGMFSCMFAEYLSRNAKITFTQNDMPYFRQKMVFEIISKRLLQ